MPPRPYNPDRDRAAVQRIWSEVGWLHPGDEATLDILFEGYRVLLADIEGEAECAVATGPGTVRYQDEDLPFTLVANVATSRVGRHQGLARRVAAAALATAATEGSLVAGLGMFEQGYYDDIGFGAGGYEHYVHFDPAALRTRTRARIPRRIGREDWVLVHTSRLARYCTHGAMSVHPPQFTQAEMRHREGCFGLGYCDRPDGSLTHHIWVDPHAGPRRGPYFVQWMTYQTPAQFQELIALIRGLGDQIHLIGMREPAGIQMQDLIEQPLKRQRVSMETERPHGVRAMADWQMRMLDLAGCLRRTHLPGDTLRFQLRLNDPVDKWMEAGSSWPGLTGDYVVELGPQSRAQRGHHPSLPTLTASVGAFTRLWLGVRQASSLALTDELAGPPELIRRLDGILRLPDPKPDWGDI